LVTDVADKIMNCYDESHYEHIIKHLVPNTINSVISILCNRLYIY